MWWLAMSSDAGRPKQYTDADLLAPIHEFVEEHGRPPTTLEYDEVSPASRRTICSRFGTYGDVIEMLEYDYSSVPGGKLQKDDLITALQDFGERLGHPPQAQEIERDDATPCHRVYYKHWNDWDAALKAAGFDPAEKPDRRGDHQDRVYSDEEMLDWIHTFVELFGVAPSEGDLRGWPGPSQTTYKKYFGGVHHAVKEAGYEPRGASDE